jgi:hypothetical protein
VGTKDRGVLGCANRGEARAAGWRMKRRGRGAEARGREAGSSGDRHCNLLATVALAAKATWWWWRRGGGRQATSAPGLSPVRGSSAYGVHFLEKFFLQGPVKIRSFFKPDSFKLTYLVPHKEKKNIWLTI